MGHEWNTFVQKDEHFVDPNIPVRQAQNIHYPGRDNELAQEVRAGLLERKSKYLKSYTAVWYVLSPTHLHEFKSADKAQAPIMSLCLPEQKLGSHSNEGSSSNKFMLKGRQTGSMHRGHSWVFRAESYDTMNAWYEDIRALTEKSPQERNAFVRQHARSISGTSQRAGSISSDGIMDEEDEEPFSASNADVVSTGPKQDELPKRPQPGGRFPSDVNLSRGLQAPLSPSSGSSGFEDRDVVAAAGTLPGSTMHQYGDAAAGAVGAEAYHRYEDEKAEEFRRQQEERAAREAATIAAPDTFEQQSEQQAAQEAAIYAAPDGDLPKAAPESSFMSGARSQGDVTTNGAITPGTNPIERVLEPLTESGRPSLAAGQNHQSVQSVSQLHVPGEFPKETKTVSLV